MEKKQSANNEMIDVGQIIATLRRNWWMFLLSLILCLSLAGVFLYAKHSVYSIHAKVLVAYDEGTGSMGSSLMQSLSLGGVGGSNIEDEVLVMGAHSIRTQAIKELGLNRSYYSPENKLKKKHYYNNSPIIISAPEEVFDTLSTSLKFEIEANGDLSRIGVKVTRGLFKTVTEVTGDKLPMVVKTPYGFYSINKTKYYQPGKPITVVASVSGNSLRAEALSQDLSVQKSEKKANGISLYYDDINIQRGKDLLNKMVELYNRRGQKEKDEMAVNTGKFIDERLDTLYISLAKSEKKIENYKEDKQIVDVNAEAEYLMQKKGSVENALLSAETTYEVLKMADDFFNDSTNNYSMMPFAPDINGLENAIASYNELIAKKMELEENAYGDNTLLITLKKQIDASRKNIKKSIGRAVENASVKLEELRAKESESIDKLSAIPAQEREFLELKRDQTIKNQLYSFLLQKREENQLVLAATTPKGKIVDEAYAFNEPIAPNKLMVVMMALFFGLLLPVMWLYARSLMSNKFASIEELSRLTSLPVIGEICHSRRAKDNPLVVSEKSTRPIAELFRLLRSNLQFMFPVKNADCGQVAMVTSSCSGEGKTFVSMNVAESLALMNKKVVLVGLDIRLPMLAQNLKLPTSPGVTNYLSGAVDNIDDLVNRHANCDIIVAGPVPPNPSELLLNSRLDQLINELKAKYDYVIIDSAPIGLVSDSFSLTRYSDVTLYVSRAKYTKKSFIKYLNSVVERGQLKNVAVVINDTNPKLSHGYGYGYGAKGDN